MGRVPSSPVGDASRYDLSSSILQRAGESGEAVNTEWTCISVKSHSSTATFRRKARRPRGRLPGSTWCSKGSCPRSSHEWSLGSPIASQPVKHTSRGQTIPHASHLRKNRSQRSSHGKCTPASTGALAFGREPRLPRGERSIQVVLRLPGDARVESRGRTIAVPSVYL